MGLIYEEFVSKCQEMEAPGNGELDDQSDELFWQNGDAFSQSAREK